MLQAATSCSLAKPIPATKEDKLLAVDLPDSSSGDKTVLLQPHATAQISTDWVSIDFSSGCVKGPLMVGLYILSGPTALGMSFAVRPHMDKQRFHQPCTVTIRLPPELHDATLDTISVRYSPTDISESSQWKDISYDAEYNVKIENGVITFHTYHFSCFGWCRRRKERYVWAEFKECPEENDGIFRLRFSAEEGSKQEPGEDYNNCNAGEKRHLVLLRQGERIQISVWFHDVECLVRGATEGTNEFSKVVKVRSNMPEIVANCKLQPKRTDRIAGGNATITDYPSGDDLADVPFRVRETG